MLRQEIVNKYNETLPIYKSLAEESLFILNEAIQKKNLKIHYIIHRIKNLDSLFKKSERKQLDDPLNQINDIVGIRIVCLFRSDIDKIGEIIQAEFETLSKDNKIEGIEVSSFGYMSFHFTVRIKQTCNGPRYDKIKNLSFEIQVRTIAMDAWASISHHLDYKTDNDVPKDLRKDFYALSGLFYVADTHFKLFYDASKKSKKDIKESIDKGGNENIELNADSLSIFLNKKYPDRKHSDAKAVSELVSELKIFKYNSISSVSNMLDKTAESFKVHEKNNPPFNKPKYADVGVVRCSLELDNNEYKDYLKEKARNRRNNFKK